MNEPTTTQSRKSNRLQPAAVVASLVLALFVLAFLLMGWIRAGQSGQVEPYPSEIEALAKNHKPRDPLLESRKRGREVYRHYCAICHGDDGDGTGFNSAQIKQPPRDFTAAEFWNETTEERVYFAIGRGGPAIGKSVLMPAWGKTLSEEQIRDVMAYLHTFSVQQSAQQD